MLCIDDKYIMIQLFEDKHIGTNMNSNIHANFAALQEMMPLVSASNSKLSQ